MTAEDSRGEQQTSDLEAVWAALAITCLVILMNWLTWPLRVYRRLRGDPRGE